MNVTCPHCGKYLNLKDLRLRSLPQNRSYWGLIVQVLSDELGYPLEEVHEMLKGMFLSEVRFIKTKNGLKEIRIPKSTTSLSTIEFNDFMTQIRTWASMELGIWLGEPGEEIPDGA